MFMLITIQETGWSTTFPSKFSLDLLNMICLAINYIYYEKYIYFRALKFNNFATSQYRDDNVIYTEISTSSKGDQYSLKMATTIQQP